MSRELLARFRGAPVLVAGDLMLDEFVWGQVSRISPEAPVPVVEVKKRTFVVGGAANAAANIASLGGRPVVAGVIGDDAAGDQICELLDDLSAETTAILKDDTRPTTTKTRIVAHSQQVVRIDHEAPGALDDAATSRLLASIERALSRVRACVLSDYGKGVATPALCHGLINLCREHGVPVIVDPKGTDYRKYCSATLVKPNLAEASKVLNRDLHDRAAVEQAGRDLLDLLGPESNVLITQGAAGMSLFERGRGPVAIPATAREVYDVTGAGDTVAGTMALALAAGGKLEAACRLASQAAAIVVGKAGTATVSLEELANAVGVPLRQAA
jgi:D-beta-D-heptose 7-phosphate kinase/D-beta-D-heptose 1-phosphate adenosyltransferase